jgi:hypothetical protein
MDQLWLSIGQIVLQWGTPGVIILYLFREKTNLEKDVKALQAKLDDSLEKRVTEAVASSKAADAMLAGLQNLTEVVRNANHWRGPQ